MMAFIPLVFWQRSYPTEHSQEMGITPEPQTKLLAPVKKTAAV